MATSVLYLLAQDSTPESAREEAIERAGSDLLDPEGRNPGDKNRGFNERYDPVDKAGLETSFK